MLRGMIRSFNMWGNWRKENEKKRKEDFPAVLCVSSVCLSLNCDSSRCSKSLASLWGGSMDEKCYAHRKNSFISSGSQLFAARRPTFGIILHFSFVLYDTNVVLCAHCRLLSKALIKFSCYFGNFPLFCQWVSQVSGPALFRLLLADIGENARARLCSIDDDVEMKYGGNDCWLYLLLKDSRDMGWPRKVRFCAPRRSDLRPPASRRPDRRGSAATARPTPAMSHNRPKSDYKANWREETFWNATDFFFLQ